MAILFLEGGAQAASDLRTDRIVVDPIQSRSFDDLAYTGRNLEPSANLTGADGRDEIVGADIAPMLHFNGSVGRNDSNGEAFTANFRLHRAFP